MACEVEKLKQKLNDLKTAHNSKMIIYTGKLYGHDVVLTQCGVGKVNAAISAQYIIDKYNPDIIINTAPTDLSSSFDKGPLPKGLRVIELASGENFKGIEGVERLPGIPDKSYGKSAGRSYYNSIMKYVSEVTK